MLHVSVVFEMFLGGSCDRGVEKEVGDWSLAARIEEEEIIDEHLLVA